MRAKLARFTPPSDTELARIGAIVAVSEPPPPPPTPVPPSAEDLARLEEAKKAQESLEKERKETEDKIAANPPAAAVMALMDRKLAVLSGEIDTKFDKILSSITALRPKPPSLSSSSVLGGPPPAKPFIFSQPRVDISTRNEQVSKELGHPAHLKAYGLSEEDRQVFLDARAADASSTVGTLVDPSYDDLDFDSTKKDGPALLPPSKPFNPLLLLPTSARPIASSDFTSLERMQLVVNEAVSSHNRKTAVHFRDIREFLAIWDELEQNARKQGITPSSVTTRKFRDLRNAIVRVAEWSSWSKAHAYYVAFFRALEKGDLVLETSDSLQLSILCDLGITPSAHASPSQEKQDFHKSRNCPRCHRFHYSKECPPKKGSQRGRPWTREKPAAKKSPPAPSSPSGAGFKKKDQA
ncbi:MAG: hypothetical protein WCK82_13000, partial [Bacteroidota bacterium]